MRRGLQLAAFLLIAVLASACSAFPGLRVLTGQEDQQTTVNNSVQSLTLVMADKGGSTDPALIAAANRIEAAAGDVDIIEIRQNDDARLFTVNLLFRPPNVDLSTLQGRATLFDAMRRAVELTWQGTMRASANADVLSVRLLDVQRINTLDNGLSFIGSVNSDFSIDRAAAASYLAGPRSLDTFYDLIVMGTLSFTAPTTPEYYEGQPNHPMYMLPAGT